MGEDLSRALASADAKLFPSTTDTWGNAPLEAQASGVPVVVSDRGGPQELMEHGVTGFRVAGGDPKALLAAMRRADGSPSSATRMGRAAREYSRSRTTCASPTRRSSTRTTYRRRRKSEKLLAELLRDGGAPRSRA